MHLNVLKTFVGILVFVVAREEKRLKKWHSKKRYDFFLSKRKDEVPC